jgi:hypothetical protein
VSKVPGTYKSRPLERIPGTDVPLPTNFPPGTVGVVAGPQARFTAFSNAMYGIISLLPPHARICQTGSVDVSGNCNMIVRQTLEYSDHDWCFIMGDDHEFANSLLLLLLEGLYSSDDVDVLVPHCLKRTPPWTPVVYSHQNEDGWYVAADLPRKGLTQIHAAGSAGMLIRRRVLEALDDPWFQPAPDAAGLNEDLYFCQKVREAGFNIYCDPALILGHIAQHTVEPAWNEEAGEWFTGYVFDQTVRFAEPPHWKKALEAVA